MKKRIFAAVLTAAMVFAAAGCGNSQTEPVTESAAAATTQEASPEVAAELEWQTSDHFSIRPLFDTHRQRYVIYWNVSINSR